MASETILHSGNFLDRNDNPVIVTFYRRTDLNVVPDSLTFQTSGGSLTLACWSRNGEVELTDYGFGDWLNYRQVRVEPIVGTDYHKYTYEIICDANSGQIRRTTLRVGIEYGQGVGDTVDVSVLQDGTPLPDWSVYPYEITDVEASGESINISFTNAPEGGMGYDIEPSTVDWITISDFSQTGATLTIGVNGTHWPRSATVKFYDLDDIDDYVTVAISQN